MSSVLLETMCLPPVPVMATLVKHSELIIEAHENYQKRSFRNRIYLSGPQGTLCFTIPLAKGKNQQKPIQDVTISEEEDWQTSLIKHVQSFYGSAPYFDYYYDSLREIICSNHTYLFELNKQLLKWVFLHIDAEINISYTEQYNLEYRISVDDMRSVFKPNQSFFGHPDLIRYNQIFEEKNGFIGNLSILDMLMCCGPETLVRLKSPK